MDAQKISIATYVAGGLGVALLLGSVLMPYVLPDRGAWSETDGQSFATAGADLHRLTHSHGEHGHSHANSEPATDETALLAARERFAAEKQRLDAAVGGRHLARSLAKWTGVALIAAAAGGAIYLRVRDLNS